MKKIFSAIALSLVVSPLFASPTLQGPEKLSVKIDFNLQQQNKNGQIEQYQIQNAVKMVTKNNEWSVVSGTPMSNSNHIVILGKVDKAYSEQAKISFLVIDTGKKPAVLSNPKFIVRYGQIAQINLGDKNDKLHLAIVAENA